MFVAKLAQKIELRIFRYEYVLLFCTKWSFSDRFVWMCWWDWTRNSGLKVCVWQKVVTTRFHLLKGELNWTGPNDATEWEAWRFLDRAPALLAPQLHHSLLLWRFPHHPANKNARRRLPLSRLLITVFYSIFCRFWAPHWNLTASYNLQVKTTTDLKCPLGSRHISIGWLDISLLLWIDWSENIWRLKH